MTKASIIPPGVALHGELEGEGDLAVFGTVLGEIRVTGPLTIERGGAVHGDVTGRSITVRGTLVGNARASERVEVDEGAKVVGDLHAPRVRVETGARFRGRVYMEGAQRAQVLETTERVKRRRARGRRGHASREQTGSTAALVELAATRAPDATEGKTHGGVPAAASSQEDHRRARRDSEVAKRRPDPRKSFNVDAMPILGRLRGAQR